MEGAPRVCIGKRQTQTAASRLAAGAGRHPWRLLERERAQSLAESQHAEEQESEKPERNRNRRQPWASSAFPQRRTRTKPGRGRRTSGRDGSTYPEVRERNQPAIGRPPAPARDYSRRAGRLLFRRTATERRRIGEADANEGFTKARNMTDT